MASTGNLCHVWGLGDGVLFGWSLLMGQEIGTCQFFTRDTAERSRKPKVSAWVEGIGDVSADIKNVTITRNLTDKLAEPRPGYCYITLEDSAGDYAENGVCVIKTGYKVRVWAGFGDNLVPRFTGVIKEAKIITQTGEVSLNIPDLGELMEAAQTSGDWSTYPTPYTFVNQLMSELRLGVPEWENETGIPATATLDNDNLDRRNYWEMCHGAALRCGYVYYFDERGRLQLKRRDGFTESQGSLQEVFDDSSIIEVSHVQQGEFFNEKAIDHSDDTVITWSGFTAGEGVRWGQRTYITGDDRSKTSHGLHTNYEAEPMITDWAGIHHWGSESLEEYKYERQIYTMRIAARPQVQIYDRIFVNSKKRNIIGRFKVIGIHEYISPGTYTEELTLLSTEEQF